MNECFSKYHGLGNDYLVIDPAHFSRQLTTQVIRRLCDRHLGIGADGILFGPCNLPESRHKSQNSGHTATFHTEEKTTGSDQYADIGVRIFNPDGSEAEKSGNGLRIFARYLQDQGYAKPDTDVRVSTCGGTVTCRVQSDTADIKVDMGHVTFDAEAIPVSGMTGEVLQKSMLTDGENLICSAASVGNPHCVVVRDSISKTETCRFGPLLENASQFPRRTNVQFMQVIDRHTIAIEIWERGAGYTLASGSSACASAAVAIRLQFCKTPVTVKMPGGTLEVDLHEDYTASLKGPVTAVCNGTICPEVYM